MAISEFTQTICRGLCVEKAIGMEAERLATKVAAMKRGSLTQADIERDNELRGDARRLYRSALTPHTPGER